MSRELEQRVTLYPDPVLRKVAAPVVAFDDELLELVASMFATMYAAHGVGLAAPQVSIGTRVLVLNPSGDPSDESEALVLVNPTIVERAGAATRYDEGCLSFPGIYAEIERPERCRVKAFTPRGEPIDAEYEGFTSRIIQHEYDHLEGVLLVDRMSPADKQRHRAALEELKETYRVEREKRGGAAAGRARRR
jgi:peptide deformylase